MERNLKKVEKQIGVLQTKQALLNELRKRDFLVGQSEVIEKIKRMSIKVAHVDTTILITGESGVGKEVAARYFHEHSNRCLAPFEVVNCAAVPEGLFESLLFGHKKGSFTGADENLDHLKELMAVLFFLMKSRVTTSMQKLLRSAGENNSTSWVPTTS